MNQSKKKTAQEDSRQRKNEEGWSGKYLDLADRAIALDSRSTDTAKKKKNHR